MVQRSFPTRETSIDEGRETSEAAGLLRPRGSTGAFLCYLFTGLLISCAVWLSLAAPRESGVAPIWPVTAVLLSIVLSASPKLGPGLLLAGGAGILATHSVYGQSPLFSLVVSLANVAEAGIGVWAIRRVLGDQLDFKRSGDILWFTLLAGVAIPAPAAAIGGTVFALSGRGDFIHGFTAWMTGDALGLLTVTPALTNLLSGGADSIWSRRNGMRTALTLALFTIAIIFVFSQMRAPVIYPVPALLILLAFELGVPGAALGLLITAVVALISAMSGGGPLGMLPSLTERVVTVQVLLAACTFTALPVAAALAERRHLEAHLRTTRRAAEAARDKAVDAERSLRQIVDGVTDYAIYMLGPDGRVSSWNLGAERITGYSAADVLGRSEEVFWTEEDLKAGSHQAALAAALADGKFESERWVLRKDGSRFFGAASIEPIHSDSGALIGYVKIGRDVTERHAAVEALKSATAKAELANRAKSDFVANMSHELRTPLTAILGFSELLMGAELKDTERHYVVRVRDASETLLTIVNDVLDFSKIEAGHIELALEPVELDAFVYESAALLGGQASLKGLHINVEMDGRLPPYVLVDPTRLRQIVLNLLGNALKFTPKGGQVTISAAPEPDGTIRFAVTDTGIGIPKEVQGKLFQRFTQADSTTTRNFGGTGLGLAICSGLARLMGGAIGVDSEPGVGSTFWFTIEAPAAERAAAAAEPEPVTLPDTLSVLLVEDNPANRQLFKALLEPLQIHVIEAVNGAEGVEAAKRGGFELILMDVQMPVMNGIEATKAIRNLGGYYADIPILGLTANVLPEQIRDYVNAGMNDVLAKPVRAADLVQKIAFWLEGPEMAIVVDESRQTLAS